MESWYRQHGYAPFNMFALPRGLKKSLWRFSCRLRATTNRIPQYSRWEWYDEHNIKHEFYTTYTNQQNRVIELKNNILITLACAILDDCETLEMFSVEAINTSCHASNRVYFHLLLETIPYGLLIGRKPHIIYLFRFLVVNATFSIRKGLLSLKEYVMLDLS